MQIVNTPSFDCQFAYIIIIKSPFQQDSFLAPDAIRGCDNFLRRQLSKIDAPFGAKTAHSSFKTASFLPPRELFRRAFSPQIILTIAIALSEYKDKTLCSPAMADDHDAAAARAAVVGVGFICIRVSVAAATTTRASVRRSSRTDP